MFSTTQNYRRLFEKFEPMRVGNGFTSNTTRVEEHTVLEELNEKTLLKYVFRTLEKTDRLKSARILPGEGEKTYTVTVYDEDNRRGGRVLFANKDDVNTLMQILVDAVGKKRMKMVKISLVGEPDEVAEVGKRFYKQWIRKEEWPFED